MYAKMNTWKVIILCSILMFVSTSSVFAASETYTMKPTKYMSNDNVIKMVSKYNTVHGQDINAFKLSDEAKEATLEATGGVDLKKAEVYIIERRMSNNEMETSVISDIAIPTNTGGVSSETKEGRITITCVLGYERMMFSNISYVKGTYYGGKVAKQPTLTVIKSLKGDYVDSGAYITESGEPGISGLFKDSTTFDPARHTTLQTQSLNRDKYFNTNMTGTSQVSAKYTATSTFTTGINSGTIYTISVNTNAYS